MKSSFVRKYLVMALCVFAGVVGCASPEKAILLPAEVEMPPPPQRPYLTLDELWDRSVSEVEKLFVIKSNDRENYEAVSEYRVDMEAGERVRRYAVLEVLDDVERPPVKVTVFKQAAKSLGEQARNGTAWTDAIVDANYTERLADAINRLQ